MYLVWCSDQFSDVLEDVQTTVVLNVVNKFFLNSTMVILKLAFGSFPFFPYSAC